LKSVRTPWIAGLVAAATSVAVGVGWACSANTPSATVLGVELAAARKPGGAATAKSRTTDRNAFSQSSANMGFARELDFKLGNAIFRKLWVSAPASTKSSDGLGPLFNARSCQRCHLKDGRGAPPRNDDDKRTRSMILQLSLAKTGTPDPIYGAQLQDLAVQGHAGEGRMRVRYEDVPVTLAGGSTVVLRKPVYSVSDLAYGPLDPDTRISPRVAPQMIGLGLLEAIPAAALMARADPDDTDGDGISGRAGTVWSLGEKRKMLGRFGWKAASATVLDQTAKAFSGDIGISTPLLPQPFGDCTTRQEKCVNAPHGGTADAPEVGQQLLDLTAFYARNLAVPRRRNVDSQQVKDGARLFASIGCASCHTPLHRTGTASPDAHLRGQMIWPYTDLLLHDMGAGLADGRRQGAASETEWRTPPLWGIGLTQTISGHTFFLHDGRARNLTEAILWHGGEGQAARDAFAGLSAEERASLIQFVESL